MVIEEVEAAFGITPSMTRSRQENERARWRHGLRVLDQAIALTEPNAEIQRVWWQKKYLDTLELYGGIFWVALTLENGDTLGFLSLVSF